MNYGKAKPATFHLEPGIETSFPLALGVHYRVAVQISSASPEAVYGLGQLLATTGRADEARQLVTNFERAHPSKDPAPVWKFIYNVGAGEQVQHP